IGDLVGRKYTFLVTIVVMGFSTFAVGLLPTFQTIGWAAPVLLVSLRLLQGLALGGEYGGAATYVAEHAAEGKRGYDTSYIQTTATLGLFLALLIIGLCRFTGWLTPAQFADWGWRLPFLVSVILLIFSVYIRLRLNESPVFQRMKAEGKGSKAALTYFPLFQALTHYVNPALESFARTNPVTVAAKDCNFHLFVGLWSKFSECDKAKDFLTKSGLSFTSTDLPATATDNVVIKIGP